MPVKVMHQQGVADNQFKIWFQRFKVAHYHGGIVIRFSLCSNVMGSETPLAELRSPFFPLKPSQTLSVSHISTVCSLPVENRDHIQDLKYLDAWSLPHGRMVMPFSIDSAEMIFFQCILVILILKLQELGCLLMVVSVCFLQWANCNESSFFLENLASTLVH